MTLLGNPSLNKSATVSWSDSQFDSREMVCLGKEGADLPTTIYITVHTMGSALKVSSQRKYLK